MTTAPSPAEETEKWLLVRKSLLLSPKLAKSVQEISESEWIKSRVSSLKRLLEECGNFHGGPKGEMWTALTLALTQHLGSDHEFVELISEHQDSLWATCSLMTVTTLGSETSLDGKVRELEEESENHQLSVSTANSTSVAPTQVYGSIDLIEPAGKDGQRFCMHHFHWKWVLLYAPLLVFLVVAVALAIGLLESKPERTKRVETFESTTVYLDTQRGLWYRGWEVSDCSSGSRGASNDDNYFNRTVSNIQLVDSDDVVYFEENVVNDDIEGFQNSQLLKTLNGPLYLLAGSVVEYRFCLATNLSRLSHPHFQLYSEFLIFNDIMNYVNYIHQSGNSGKDSAIFYQETLIPGVGEGQMCTNITFRVSKADYYFTMYKLPPHVELQYHSNIHVVYLNYTKYLPKEQMECNLAAGGSCEISIPENTFSTEDFTILAYIPLQSSDIAPNSTHLCVTTKQSLLVSLIPGVLSGFVLMLLVVVLVCQIISFVNSVKRRKGYLCIKPINV